MALEDILSAIRRETETEIDRIVAESDAAVEAIAATSEREAAAVQAATAGSRDAAAAGDRQRIVNRARLEADRRVHSVAEDVFVEMKRRVETELAGVRGSNGYDVLLARLLDECLALLPDARVIHIAPNDAASMRKIVAEHQLDGFVVTADVDTLGGLELRSGDGRVIRNTLEARLERADRHLRRLVHELVPPLRELAS